MDTDGDENIFYNAIDISDFKRVSFAAEHIENKYCPPERSISAYYADQIRSGGRVSEAKKNDVALQFVQSIIATIATQRGETMGLNAPRLHEDTEIKA